MKSYELHERIGKFLKQLDLIENSSTETLRAYGSDLAQVFAKIEANKDLSDQDLLQMAKNFLFSIAKLSPATRQRKGACLKSFFNWLYREQLIKSDISQRLTLNKNPQKIPHFLSVDEVIALLKTLTERLEEKNARLTQTLILLLYGGGLRVSEACALKWQNVQLPKQTLLIKGKGQKERLIALPEICCKVLADYKTINGDNPYVFGENALSTRKAYELVRHWGLLAGLSKPLNPHALRHSYATHILSSGANLRTLQELLGHQSLRATEKYLHLGINELARTLETHHPIAKKKIYG